MNKGIVCWLLLCGFQAVASVVPDDFSEAIRKSDKAKVIEILRSRNGAYSYNDRWLADEICEKRSSKKLNATPGVVSIVSDGMIGTGLAAVLFFGAMAVAGLPVRNQHGGYDGNHPALYDAGKVGCLCALGVVVAGVLCKALANFESKSQAKQKYADACYIDDLLNGRRFLSKHEANENEE